MLTRQMSLLAMLQLADRPVQRLELVKWAFLLRQERVSSNDAALYEFFPYHFGPYSFSLARDMDSLVREGLVVETANEWTPKKGFDATSELRKPLLESIRAIVVRCRRQTIDRLLDDVYRRYPEFTMNSRRERLRVRPIAAPAVYTAGYEGMQVDGFLNLLIQSGIQKFLDIRRNPVARRFGFHKSTLDRLCSLVGIGYQHIPELGIASEERRNLTSADEYRVLFDRYERVTLSDQHDRLNSVSESMQREPSVLVCFEADPANCHRSRTAGQVARITGLDIRNLGSFTK